MSFIVKPNHRMLGPDTWVCPMTKPRSIRLVDSDFEEYPPDCNSFRGMGNRARRGPKWENANHIGGGNDMAYRVAQWGTGLVGSAVVRAMADHPELETVACFAHSKAKVGQDVGTLSGTRPLGVLATDRIEDIIAAKPDCVLYMPLVWSVDDMVQLLEAGLNVISTANFITGRSFGDEAKARLDAAARRGGVSLYGTGINPGLADIMALAVTAACAKVYKVTVREAVDCTKYASKDTWASLGFGGPPGAPGLGDQVKQRSLVFVDTVEMVADALKVQLDEIDFDVEFATANEDFDLGWMHFGKGTVCGLSMKYSGKVGGRTVIELQQAWTIGYAMTPHWPAEGYVITVEGEPDFEVKIHSKGDKSGGGSITGMNAVHAVPAVCAARPGIVTAAELPLIVAAHCVRPEGRPPA
jgi:hypothetical protein